MGSAAFFAPEMRTSPEGYAALNDQFLHDISAFFRFFILFPAR